MKICIGLLTNRGYKWQTVLSLAKLIAYSKEHEFHFAMITTGYTISENRNYLAAQAVKNECQYLFSIDDDMVFPENTLEVLLSRQKDIIGVPYHVKKLPVATVTMYYDEDEPHSETEPVRALAVGAGIVLINTDVFKKMEQPWYDIDKWENGMTKTGEDNWFCFKAEKAGFQTWSEPTLKDVGHVGDFIY